MTGPRPSGTSAAEISRRRAVVVRYAALQRPSAADDMAAANELGLSVDSLLRMASLVRRRGAEAPLMGERLRASDPLVRGQALAELQADIDLSQIHPQRVDIVGRRLAAIRGFLADERRGRASLHEHAGRAGLGSRAFAKLVRSWVLLRSVEEVPGARMAVRRARKSPDERDRAGRYLEQALAELGMEATGPDVHARVVELCAAEGATPPSLSTIYVRLRSRRPGHHRRRRRP